WETWKAKREELDQAKVNARKIYRLDLPSGRHPRTETQGQDPQAISPKRFTAMIYIMEALIALLEDEHSTSSELDSVNVPSLTETIVKLLNLLNDKNAKLKGDS
ncbi:hypothetical protein HY771_01040, partial [Candidatus Uhrbacteria bacterium]|nr:hypothetical protein [Candidatus Uhrbacteria bacterium]